MRWSSLYLTFLLGCPKPADIADPEPAPASTPTSTASQTPNLSPGAPVLTPQVVAIGRCTDEDKAPLTVSHAQVEGDKLIATVQYGGGCAEHTFTACWNGALAKSMPPQATLRIIHDAGGDTCRARKTEALSLDLKEAGFSKPTTIHLHDNTVHYGQ